MPQERIPPKVCPGPAAVATLALRGEEAVWDMHSELRGDFKPHSPPGQGWALGSDLNIAI